MAKRLKGDASTHFRTTDHTEEIAYLQAQSERAETPDWRLNYRLAAELLQSHDETGISLDDWPTARRFVESYLGKSILPNLI